MHQRSRVFIFFWFSFIFLLVGCNHSRLGGEDAVSPEAWQETIPARLLGYVPRAWLQLRLANLIGARFHFLDLNQLRQDLVVNESMGSLDEIILLSRHTQGLQLLPESMNLFSPNNSNRWGWELADVEGVLFIEDLDTGVVLGSFNVDQITSILSEEIEFQTSSGDDAVLLSLSSGEALWLSPEAILVSGLDHGDQLLDQMVKAHEQGLGAVYDRSVAQILSIVDPVWGGVWISLGDLEAYSEEVNQSMEAVPEEVMNLLEDQWGVAETSLEADWDVALLGYAGVEDGYRLYCYYRYYSSDLAEIGTEVAEHNMTRMRLLSYQQTWAEVMTILDISVISDVVIVVTHTEWSNLLHSVFVHRDFHGLLPIEY